VSAGEPARLTPPQRRLRELQQADYSHLPLSAATEVSVDRVRRAAEAVYGERWNFYSNALRREVVHVFERALDLLAAAGRPLAYLEIGSCQGLSMSLVGELARNRDVLGRLVSIDPYFEGGYVEGAASPWGVESTIRIDKTTRDGALELYRSLALEVELLEETSTAGLKRLVRADDTFDLIYVDGSHEGLLPFSDTGLAVALLAPGGVVVLDDHHWPDVKQVKEICDRHCRHVGESWKLVAYRPDG